MRHSRPAKQRLWLGPDRYISGCGRRIAHANAYSYSHSHSYCYSNGNCDADTGAESDAISYTVAQPEPVADAVTDTLSDAESVTIAKSHTVSDTEPLPNPQPKSHAHSITHTDTITDACCPEGIKRHQRDCQELHCELEQRKRCDRLPIRRVLEQHLCQLRAGV